MQTYNEAEREYLFALLIECKGNMTEASNVSGLARATLYRLVFRHNLKDHVQFIRQRQAVEPDLTTGS